MPASSAGYAAWGRPRVQGQRQGCRRQAGTRPLTLDLQDLVAEVGLEVVGAVGWEHQSQAGEEGKGEHRSLMRRGTPHSPFLFRALEPKRLKLRWLQLPCTTAYPRN